MYFDRTETNWIASRSLLFLQQHNPNPLTIKPMPDHVQQVLRQLHLNSEAAVKRSKEVLKQSRAGTLPKPTTLIVGNHMQIFYEDERLEENFISAGATAEEKLEVA